MSSLLEFCLSDLSSYRAELMGLATLAILICHAPANVPQIPYFVATIATQGGVFGNTIFFFLSGMGLWFSLKQQGDFNLLNWYKRRYLRLLLPYLIICVPIQLVYVSGGGNFWSLIKYITGVSYWLNHDGCWFVCALVPLYAFAPLIYKLTNLPRSCVYLLCICIGLLLFNVVDSEKHSVVDNLQMVLSHYPIFILGMWSAKYIQRGKTVNMLTVLAVVLLILLLRWIFRFEWFHLGVFLVIPCLIFGLCFIKLINLFCRKMLQAFSVIGSVSLESYVFNVSLPKLFFSLGVLSSYDHAPGRYALIVTIGLLLSFPVSKVSRLIEKV